VTISAILYVREKMLIAIAKVEGQEVEEKVPVIILVRNEWFKRSQASYLAEKACLKTQPFKGIYEKLMTGKEIKDEEAYAVGEVPLTRSRDAKTVTVHMLVLKSSESIEGVTFIQ
jgi:hypothetical protein